MKTKTLYSDYEQCYEFLLKYQSTYSADHKRKYENYLKNKKK